MKKEEMFAQAISSSMKRPGEESHYLSLEEEQ